MAKTYSKDKLVKAKVRKDFMEAGGYDGRFATKSVPSKTKYSRKGKNKNFPQD